MKFVLGLACVGAMLLHPSFPVAAADGMVSIVKEGKPSALVIIPAEVEIDKDPTLRKTLRTDTDRIGQEFVSYIKRISGADIPLKKVAPEQLEATLAEAKREGVTPVLIGSLALRHSSKHADTKLSGDPSSFVILADEEAIAIGGSTPRGAEIGTHALLEQFGVRWFIPGELGTVVPISKTVKVKHQRKVEKPTFHARNFQLQHADDWIRHQRAGGPFFPGGHGIPLGPDATFEKHPEYFALVKGVRKNGQLCISNPEVLRLAVAEAQSFFRKNPAVPWYGMGPEDGEGTCECKECVTLDGGDYDAFSSVVSVTDRYVWFFNQVLEQLKDEFPDKKIAFYVYHNYMRPPVKIKPDPKIVAAIAPISLCRRHGMNNPVCPERGYLKTIIDSWSKILPEVYERGYWFNLADPGMFFIQTSRLQDEIAYYAKNGITGFRTECMGHWAAEGPSLYVAGRLMWDATLSAEAVQREFCEGLFGNAADLMNEFFTKIDHQAKDSNLHAGSAFDVVKLYPAPFRLELANLLKKAKTATSDPLQQKRIEIFELGFALTDNLANMIDATNRLDWSTAHAHLQELDKIEEKLVNGYDSPMISPVYMKQFLKRFYRLPVEQGFARSSGDNEVVANLLDRWEFQIDPLQVGADLHYERPDFTGGGWQKQPTYTMTWDALGLRYYKGLAWYRQEVEISADAVGKRLFLWFGGLDETARIWVNGKLIGTSSPSAFTPFELDATEAVHPGKNIVTVCVANNKTDELGTGGLTSPAFFYAPAKGMDAKLENIKPLRHTFP